MVLSIRPGKKVSVSISNGIVRPFLGHPGEPIPVLPAPADKPTKATGAPATERRLQAAVPADQSPRRAGDLEPKPAQAAPAAPALFRISPRARRSAADCIIESGASRGSGPLGRVVEKDVRDYLQAKGYSRIRISPVAKQLAARENLDILNLPGTGDSGRIGLADVQRALAEHPRPMSRMRQIIAQRLTQSVAPPPTSSSRSRWI